MTEGKLARWLKHVGDEVRAGDVIAEIETDKATMEVEAVDEGKLAQILVDEGTEGVAVNTPIAVLSMNGEAVAMAPAAAPAAGSRRCPPVERLPDARQPALRDDARGRAGRRSPRRRKRIGGRPRRSPSAKRCAMRWRRKCAPTRTCS